MEGPTILRLGAEWIVYYDEYTRHKYGAIRSTDLETWHVISDRIAFPRGARHGTTFRVPRRVAVALER